jgi:2-keto-4-pentenoate hydratase/2-oxohepta-3-ene-1,7-dioic acid hydratase in catechol pathway
MQRRGPTGEPRVRPCFDRWLQPGDVVELEIEGIGGLRNRVGPEPA